jgi:ATP adenylyltransferase
VYDRKEFDLASYAERVRTAPCFICELVRGNLQGNHIILSTSSAIVFLNKYPTLYGYTLVAPLEHKEGVTSDFTPDEYLDLQRLVYSVAETVRQEVPAERVYILSLGSQQGNRHVHWHVAPLPPGVPFEEQQLEALRATNGTLDIPEEEMRALASRLRARLKQTLTQAPEP